MSVKLEVELDDSKFVDQLERLKAALASDLIDANQLKAWFERNLDACFWLKSEPFDAAGIVVARLIATPLFVKFVDDVCNGVARTAHDTETH